MSDAKIWRLEGGGYLVEGYERCVVVNMPSFAFGQPAADWASTLRRVAQRIDDACLEADARNPGLQEVRYKPADLADAGRL